MPQRVDQSRNAAAYSMCLTDATRRLVELRETMET